MTSNEYEVLDYDADVSPKSYVVAVCLSGIFGVLGIQHFYLERWGLGILDLGLSISAFVLWHNEYFLIGGLIFLVDIIHTVIVTFQLLVGKFKDGDGRLVPYPGQKNV